MYLKSLSIFESLPELKEIRKVTFKKGLNIIVDESTTSEGKGNNVGKTTFLKIIDICLGAKDRKYIWTDNDTGSETTILKEYLHTSKIFATLEIVDNENNKYRLKVELFERGKRYINDEAYSYNLYTEKLNNIIFNTSKPPSFRQLIGKFVRINQKNDTNTFLKYLNQNTTDVTYQNIYEFLFKLSAEDISQQKLSLKNEIRSLEDDLKKILRLHNFTNLKDLQERTRIVNNTVEQLRRNLDAVIKTSEMKRKLDESSKLRSQLGIINDAINEENFKKNKVIQILEKESSENSPVNNELLLDFYHEISSQFDGISKKFNDLIEFNKQIHQNKINYYSKRLSKINKSLNNLKARRNLIIENNKELISLINEDNYPEFEKIQKELLTQSELLGELKKVKLIFENLTKNLKKKNSAIADLDFSEESTDNLSKFNEYLTELSNTVFGQRLYLTSSEPFPIKLSNVDDGIGTGHRKTITLLLDIAYVSFINELELDYPRFFIHDVIETIDEHNFLNIVNFINNNDSQFVFAILNEKIKKYSFIQDEDIRLRLSIDNKLFGI
ncbi:hypothetical protein [Lysinibacillus fusiformis]|uniref:hypothetical protein n=1 Tax=Lysinibacillus fusiformis TaxID=28031 RepID=UPI003809F98F